MSEPPIFEQLPREGDKAFEAFGFYLGLGPGRTLVKAAERCRKSVSLLGRWSVKFDWPGRVKAHAAHFGGLERRAAEAVAVAKGTDWGFRKEKHREDEWQMRDELMEGSREVLKKFRDGSKGATLGDVARAIDLASKLGRLASGLDLEKPVEDKGQDVNVLVAIDVVLDRIYGKAPAAAGVPVVDVETAPAVEAPAAGVEAVAVAAEQRGHVLRDYFRKGGTDGAV